MRKRKAEKDEEKVEDKISMKGDICESHHFKINDRNENFHGEDDEPQ